MDVDSAGFKVIPEENAHCEATRFYTHAIW